MNPVPGRFDLLERIAPAPSEHSDPGLSSLCRSEIQGTAAFVGRKEITGTTSQIATGWLTENWPSWETRLDNQRYLGGMLNIRFRQ